MCCGTVVFHNGNIVCTLGPCTSVDSEDEWTKLLNTEGNATKYLLISRLNISYYFTKKYTHIFSINTEVTENGVQIAHILWDKSNYLNILTEGFKTPAVEIQSINSGSEKVLLIELKSKTQ